MQGQTNPGLGTGESLDIVGKDGLQTQESLGRWMNYVMTDSPGSVDDPILESSISTGHNLSMSPMMDDFRSAAPGQVFRITDVSPPWAFSNEETKVLSFVTVEILFRQHLVMHA